MKLHTFPGSPNGRKVECLAGYLGINLELRLLDMRAGELRSDAFLAISPMGKVPVLEDGDYILRESNAILLYLATKHPEGKLVPQDETIYFRMVQWMFWQTAHWGPLIGRLFGERVFKPKMGKQPDQAVIEQTETELHRSCKVLEAELQGKEFVCGPRSVADYALGPWAEGLPHTQVSLEPYPNIAAWIKRLQESRGWVFAPSM